MAGRRTGTPDNHRLDRRQLLKAAAAGAAAAPLAGCLGPAARPAVPAPGGGKTPKNLVFIVADTFRADRLGCYGGKTVKTPCLDKLAAESTVFTHAYADGLPTIPCRRVYHTGKSIVPMRKRGGWIPLKPGATTQAKDEE